jgi:hypothetical protein
MAGALLLNWFKARTWLILYTALAFEKENERLVLCGKKTKFRVFCNMQRVVNFFTCHVDPTGGPEWSKYSLSVVLVLSVANRPQ